MIIRLAKTGKNAGNKFYGCSTYPNCKGTLPYNTSEVINNETLVSTSGAVAYSINNTIKIPKEFKARSKFEHFQSKFFDIIAVRDEYLKKRSNNEHFENQLQSISKWRLDYPISNKNSLPTNIQNCLAVFEKILLRGHITRLSQDLENLITTYPIQGENNKILNNSQVDQTDKWLDGYGPEKMFYNHTLPILLGPNYRDYVIPQVDITSLSKHKSQPTDKLKCTL